MGLIQRVQVQMDEKSRAELISSFQKAGVESMAALKRAFDMQMAGLRESLAKGIINKEQFKKAADEAGQAFNQGIIARVKDLGAQGKLTNEEYVKLTKTLKQTGTDGAKSISSVSGAMNTLKGVLGAVGITFGLMQLKTFIIDLVRLGMGAGETASKFSTTFGPATEKATAFLEGFANKAGLSSERGQDLLATIGAMTQGMGLSKEASFAFGERILKLAADLQSFHNVPIAQTFADIRSGLVGQSEPMRKYGVLLTEAAVAQRAMNDTGKSSADQLTQLEKVQARMNLMWEQGGVALGDLERTQDSAANTTRRLGAEWLDIKTNFGSALIEIVQGSGALSGMGDILERMAGWVERNKDEIIKFGGEGVAVLTELLGKLFDKVGEGVGQLSAFWEGLKTSNAAVEETNLRLTDAENVFKNTGRELKQLSTIFEIMGEAFNRVGFAMGAAFATVFMAIIEKIADLDEALARFTSKIPGMGSVTKALEEEAARARSRVEHLKEFITGQEMAIQNSYTKTKTLQLDLQTYAQHSNEEITQEYSGEAENRANKEKETTDKIKGNQSDASQHGIAKVKELSDATKKHMSEMSAAYSAAGQVFLGENVGSILRGRDEVVKAFAEMQKAGVQSSDEMRKANDIMMSSYIDRVVPAMLQGHGKEQAAIHETRDAVDELTDRIKAGTDYYTDEHVPAHLRGARDIDDSLHQNAAAQEGVTDTFRGGEQYYTQQYTPAILAGHGKQQEAAKKTEDVHVSAYDRIKSVVSDVQAGIGGLIDVLGLGDTAVGKVAKGFAEAAGKAVNFVGSIMSGNWIGALTQGLGLIGDIAGALGGLFGGHKEEDRQKDLGKLRDQAEAGDAAALERLYQLSSRGSPDGSIGAATRESRDLAWKYYLGAGGNKPDTRVSGRGQREKDATDRGQGYHIGGVVGDGTGDPRELPAGSAAGAPRAKAGALVGLERFHNGGLMRNERLIVAEVGELILPRRLTEKLFRQGGSSHSLSRTVHFNGPLHIHAGAGVNGAQIGREFISYVNRELGAKMADEAARGGNTTL